MTNQSNVNEILEKCPDIVDYLSIDVDDACLAVLELIDLEKTHFKCITIEHNKYLGTRGNQRHRQREILSKAGYFLLCKNVDSFNMFFPGIPYLHGHSINAVEYED